MRQWCAVPSPVQSLDRRETTSHIARFCFVAKGHTAPSLPTYLDCGKVTQNDACCANHLVRPASIFGALAHRLLVRSSLTSSQGIPPSRATAAYRELADSFHSTGEGSERHYPGTAVLGGHFAGRIPAWKTRTRCSYVQRHSRCLRRAAGADRAGQEGSGISQSWHRLKGASSGGPEEQAKHFLRYRDTSIPRSFTMPPQRPSFGRLY